MLSRKIPFFLQLLCFYNLAHSVWKLSPRSLIFHGEIMLDKNQYHLVTLSDHFIGNENFSHNLQTLWSVHTSFSRKGLIFLIFIIPIKIFPAHHFSCYHSRSFRKLCPLWKVSLSRNIGEMRCDCWPKFFLLFFVWSPPRNVKIPFLRPFIVALKR